MQNLSCHLKTTQARSIVFAKWEALPHPKRGEFSISEIMKILVGRGGGGGGASISSLLISLFSVLFLIGSPKSGG